MKKNEKARNVGVWRLHLNPHVAGVSQFQRATARSATARRARLLVCVSALVSLAFVSPGRNSFIVCEIVGRGELG